MNRTVTDKPGEIRPTAQPLRIGIGAISAGGGIYENWTGLRTYLLELWQGLAEIDRKNRYVCFVPPRMDVQAMEGRENFSIFRCPHVPDSRFWRVAYEHSVYSHWIRSQHIDIYLDIQSTVPLGYRGPAVVVVQSVQFFSFPESTGFLRRSYWKWVLRRSVRKASEIICVSHDSKKILRQRARADDSRIHVVYNAVADCLRVQAGLPLSSNEQAFVAAATGGFPFVLTVSNLLHVKNLPRLIEAFGILKASHPIPHRLVIIGSRGDYSEGDLEALAAKVGLEGQLICLGSMSNDRVGWFYRKAAVSVLPSISETFGLVVLESMTLGCPVAASRISALQEVAGFAIQYFDPYSAQEMADAIAEVLLNERLRRDLIARGTARAREFTWQNTATQTLEILEAVASRSCNGGGKS